MRSETGAGGVSVRVYIVYDGEPGGPITRLADAVAEGRW
jgi:hypothetical protein